MCSEVTRIYENCACKCARPQFYSDAKNLLFYCLPHKIKLLLRSLASGSLAPQQLRYIKKANSSFLVRTFVCAFILNNSYTVYLKNSTIFTQNKIFSIHKSYIIPLSYYMNTKKNHKRVVVLYVIKNHVNLHKL